MTETLRCISPIDGSIIAERKTMTRAEADDALDLSKKAQVDWAKKSIQERTKLIQSAILLLGENQEETAIELAKQMGRPIRYGGEYSGFKFRADTLADLAETALDPIIVEDNDIFNRRIECYTSIDCWQ